MKNLVIIGHSAAGKSATLDALGLDRIMHDFDLYLEMSQNQPTIHNLMDWVKVNRETPIVAISNHPHLIRELSINKKTFSDFSHFLYLKRPKEIIRRNLSLVNTDGHTHTQLSESDFENYYYVMNEFYEKIADITIDLKDITPTQVADQIKHEFLPQTLILKNRVLLRYHFDEISFANRLLTIQGWCVPKNPIEEKIIKIELGLDFGRFLININTTTTQRPDVAEALKLNSIEALNSIGFHATTYIPENIKGDARIAIFGLTNLRKIQATTYKTFSTGV